jgi:hypothetical protein
MDSPYFLHTQLDLLGSSGYLWYTQISMLALKKMHDTKNKNLLVTITFQGNFHQRETNDLRSICFAPIHKIFDWGLLLP